jgi:ribosomal protein S13
VSYNDGVCSRCDVTEFKKVKELSNEQQNNITAKIKEKLYLFKVK